MVPPPIPISGVSKSPLPRGKQIWKNTLLIIFHEFYEKGQKKVRRENYSGPPDLGGGMLANILPGGDVRQLSAKIQQKAGKRPFLYAKYNMLYQKYIK